MSSKVKFGTRNLTRQIIFDSLIEFKHIVIDYINCIKTTNKEVCLDYLAFALNSHSTGSIPSVG